MYIYSIYTSFQVNYSWSPGSFFEVGNLDFFYDTNPGETAGGHLKPGILSITLSLC